MMLRTLVTSATVAAWHFSKVPPSAVSVAVQPLFAAVFWVAQARVEADCRQFEKSVWAAVALDWNSERQVMLSHAS